MQRLVLAVESDAVNSLAAHDEDVLGRVLVVVVEVLLPCREIRRQRVGAGVDHRVGGGNRFRPLGRARREAGGGRDTRVDLRVQIQAREHRIRGALRHTTLLIRPRLRQIGTRRLEFSLDEREDFRSGLRRTLFDLRVGCDRHSAVGVVQLHVVQRTQRPKFGLDRGLVRDGDVVQRLEHDVGAGNAGVHRIPDLADFAKANDAVRRPALLVQLDPGTVVEPVTTAGRHDSLVGADLVE